MPKIRLAWLAIAATTLCTACATPGIVPDKIEIPPAFENQGAAQAARWPSLDWYRGFGSDELDSLIALAEQNNFDLAAASARIRQADARARAAGAAILPQIDLTANANHVRGGARGISAYETDWSALLSASYELDFWGRNRATSESTRLLLQASGAERETLAMTTLTGVANSFFQVASLRERVALAQSNLDSAREVLRIIEARYNAGAAAAIELATQRAAVAAAELAIAPLQHQEIDARGALAILLGHVPENFSVEAQGLDGLAEPVVTAGLPSALLARRPDVLAAEFNLRAAHADLAAARAAMFPSLTLTASGGAQNPAVQAAVVTLEGTGYSLAIGAALVQTVFDGGRRHAARDEALARQDELLATYRSAILNALQDVEVALSSLRHLDLQRAAQSENLTQSERAFEGARLRYRAGSGDYLAVLDAQRTLFAARDQDSQYRLQRLQAVVGLCKALGGGWPK